MLAVETVLGWPRSRILAAREERLNQSDLIRLYDCAKLLAKGFPLQYVLGEAWFMNCRFNVNPAVLIPRPETEEMVMLMVKQYDGRQKASVLDIGTGSGCIAVSLKKNCPELAVNALDISSAALAVARSNARRNHVRVNFFQHDILAEELTNTYEVIVSNPPYVVPSEAEHMEERVLKHEPDLALFALEHDPVIFYRRIIDLCSRHLSASGHVWFELNPLTATEVLTLAEQSGLFSEVLLLQDMSGKTRFLKARKK